MSEHTRNTGAYYLLHLLPRLLASLKARAWIHKTWTRNFTTEAQEHKHALKNKKTISLFTSVCFTYVRHQQGKQMGHTMGTERPVDFKKKKATLTNYACTPLLILCMQEFCPQEVRQRVWCVQNCVLSCPMPVKSKSNNGCALFMCAVHYIWTVKAIAFC